MPIFVLTLRSEKLNNTGRSKVKTQIKNRTASELSENFNLSLNLLSLTTPTLSALEWIFFVAWSKLLRMWFFYLACFYEFESNSLESVRWLPSEMNLNVATAALPNRNKFFWPQTLPIGAFYYSGQHSKGYFLYPSALSDIEQDCSAKGLRIFYYLVAKQELDKILNQYQWW